jgi:hypothetical protein
MFTLQVGCGSSYCPGPGMIDGTNYPYGFVVICQYLPPVRFSCMVSHPRARPRCATQSSLLHVPWFVCSKPPTVQHTVSKGPVHHLQGNVNGPDNYIVHVKNLKAK